MEFHTLYASLMGISGHRGLMDAMLDVSGQPGPDTPDVRIMEYAERLLFFLKHKNGENALQFYTNLFYALRGAGCEGLGDWLWGYLRHTETPYARLIERGGSDPALENAARRDIETLVLLAETDCDRFIDAMKPLLGEEYGPVLASLPRWRAAAPFDFESLTQFYRTHGAGQFAECRAFLWEDGRLIPVSDPEVRDGEVDALPAWDGGPASDRNREGKLDRYAQFAPLLSRTAAEVHSLHRRPGFRSGRQDLLGSENDSGRFLRETARECGDLRHLKPPASGPANLLRTRRRGSRYV